MKNTKEVAFTSALWILKKAVSELICTQLYLQQIIIEWVGEIGGKKWIYF